MMASGLLDITYAFNDPCSDTTVMVPLNDLPRSDVAPNASATLAPSPLVIHTGSLTAQAAAIMALAPEQQQQQTESEPSELVATAAGSLPHQQWQKVSLDENISEDGSKACFHVNSVILALRSKVFNRLFQKAPHKTSLEKKLVLDIPTNEGGSVAQFFFKWFYTTRLDDIFTDDTEWNEQLITHTFLPLLSLAARFEVGQLVDDLVENLLEEVSNLSTESFVILMENPITKTTMVNKGATRYTLRTRLADCMYQVQGFPLTQPTMNLPLESFTLLLNTAAKEGDSEQTLWRAVQLWLAQREEMKEIQTKDEVALWSKIYLGDVSGDFLTSVVAKHPFFRDSDLGQSRLKQAMEYQLSNRAKKEWMNATGGYSRGLPTPTYCNRHYVGIILPVANVSALNLDEMKWSKIGYVLGYAFRVGIQKQLTNSTVCMTFYVEFMDEATKMPLACYPLQVAASLTVTLRTGATRLSLSDVGANFMLGALPCKIDNFTGSNWNDFLALLSDDQFELTTEVYICSSR